MIWVDYCILVVFLLSVLIGLWRGLTRELLSLMTWLLAFAMAWWLGDDLAAMIAGKISDPALRKAVAMAALFFGGLLIGALITHAAVQAVRDSSFSPADRTLGAGVGLLRAVLVVTLFVLVAGRLGARDDRWWQESMLVQPFSTLAQGLETVIPERWLALLKPSASAPPASPSSPGT
ncbi:MAG TPA: CvpA family protein [Solimonas sp.]